MSASTSLFKIVICCLGSVLIVGCVVLGFVRVNHRPNPITLSTPTADPCKLVELRDTGTIARSKQLASNISVNLEWDLSVDLSLNVLEPLMISQMIHFESHARMANGSYGKVGVCLWTNAKQTQVYPKRCPSPTSQSATSDQQCQWWLQLVVGIGANFSWAVVYTERTPTVLQSEKGSLEQGTAHLSDLRGWRRSNWSWKQIACDVE